MNSAERNWSIQQCTEFPDAVGTKKQDTERFLMLGSNFVTFRFFRNSKYTNALLRRLHIKSTTPLSSFYGSDRQGWWEPQSCPALPSVQSSLSFTISNSGTPKKDCSPFLCALVTCTASLKLKIIELRGMLCKRRRTLYR